jgi:Glypican
MVVVIDESNPGSKYCLWCVVLAEHSSVCGHGSLTCCTRQMEAKLTSHSRQHFYTLVSERLNGVRSDFQTRTATFEGQFRYHPQIIEGPHIADIFKHRQLLNLLTTAPACSALTPPYTLVRRHFFR